MDNSPTRSFMLEAAGQAGQRGLKRGGGSLVVRLDQVALGKRTFKKPVKKN
jgi:hypothetical protein